MTTSTQVRSTGRYALHVDWIGHYTIVRRADDACIYLQGEDADALRADLYRPREVTEKEFDSICSNYDEVMISENVAVHAQVPPSFSMTRRL